MGILRTDRVTGLGGANAITGSTFFGNGNGTAGNYLRIETGTTEDFAFGTGDFTIEFWFNRIALSVQQHFYDFRGTTNTNTVLVYMTSNVMYYFGNGGQRITSGTVPSGEWVHFALVRSSASTKMYFNGTQTGSTYSDSLNLVSPPEGSGFIGSNGGTDGIRPSGSYLAGHISNFRVQKGKAEYTADFTPPTHRLEKTPETVLLTCNSSGNVSNEETGKVVIPEKDTLNDALPQASRFTPNSPVGFSTTTDVGTQFGSTFDGVTTFDSQAYMVPPGGNTRERNRGRGVISGGRNNHAMQFVNIQSQGNSQTFGDSITGDGIEGFAVGSSTRGLFSGGYPSVGNVIEFITFATTSNGTDFGDMTTGRRSGAGAGNETRGLFAGGLNSSGTTLNTIEFSTIATLGNSTDFGDLTATRDQLAGCSDTTRAIFAGGKQQASPSPEYNIIDFVTIATTGNAQDFGDISQVTTGSSASSDSTRGIIVLGYTAPGPMINIIEFVTIQTTGNAQDFGDLIQARYLSANMSNSIRAVIAGGGTPSASNTIDFVTIKTTGNALDFGDLVGGANFVNVGTSDSHGGLS